MPILSIDIEARLAKFQDGLDEVVKRTGKSAQQMDSAFAGLRSTLTTFAGLAVGGSLVAGFKNTIKELADLNDGAAQAGISVEALSSLINTLAPTGVGLQEVVDLTNKIVKAALQADDATSQQARAFKALGIATRDTAGDLRGADALITDVSKAFAGYENGANKVALAQSLLGKTGASFLPVLGDLATRTREAATVTTEQAQAADDLADNIATLTRSFTLLRQELVAGVAPALSDFFKRYLALAKLGSGPVELIAGLFGDSPEQQVAGFQRRIDELKRIREKMASEGAPSFMQRALNPALRTKDDIDEELIDLAGKLARAKQIKEQFDTLFAAPPPGPSGQAPAVSGKATPAVAAKQSEIDKYIESLQKQLAKTIDLNATETLYYQESLGLLGKVTNKELERAAAIARVIDENEKKNDLLKQEAELVKLIDEALSRDAKSITDQAAAWRDSVDPVREVTRELERINGLVGEIGGLTEQEGALARFLLGNKLDGLHAVSEGLSEADEWAKQAAKNIQDSLGQHLFDVLDGKFVDIGKSFGTMLKRMAAEAMAANLARSLFGDFGKTKEIGGWFGDGLKWLATAFGGAKAGGGPVSSGTAYLVGEKGPELFVPNTGGKIIPNGQSGMNYAPTVNVYGEMSHSQEARLAVMMRNVAEATIANRSRRMLA